MHKHWDTYLNVKELVKEAKPDLVVELGAGGGENTEQYLELQKEQPFKLVVISDGNCPERLKQNENFEWRFKISYLELPSFADNSIDFCSIDTDHNYWTLKQELSGLNQKMKKGGIVVLHDTETYRHNSGIMYAYNTGDAYPKDIPALQNKGMGDAILEEIEAGNYKVIKESLESQGATALERL